MHRPGRDEPAWLAEWSEPAPDRDRPPSRQLVGVLGIVLGGLGVHRFLLGHPGIGLVQILVTLLTLGLGGWWGVVEGIMILAGARSFARDAHGRPLRE